MAASRTGVVGVPSVVDVMCVLSFTSAFPTQHRWVMIKTNFQPKIGLRQPNALTQRSQPSVFRVCKMCQMHACSSSEETIPVMYSFDDVHILKFDGSQSDKNKVY